ncbi:hypothetical protein BH09SUM1_BH09SUM1_14870 [soil metagenome]
MIRSSRRRATALVLVLWISFCLVVVAVYFAHTARLTYLSSDNALAGMRADQAIAGAQRYVSYGLETYVTAGDFPETSASTTTGSVSKSSTTTSRLSASMNSGTTASSSATTTGDFEFEAVPVGQAKFWIIGRDTDATVAPTEPVFGLVDEASKLNLNTATVEMLEALPNMTPEVAAAIVDWRDTDSDVTTGGAESSDYLLLDNGYSAKDGPFETPEELGLVKGVDMALLYGEDTNRNGILDPNEDDGDASWPPDNADGILDPGIIEYVTTFTRDSNTQADGSERINLKGSSAITDLRDALTTAVGQQRANQIMLTVTPRLASMNSVLEFYQLSGLSEAEFTPLADKLSVSGSNYVQGLVNVNTAPAAVLACLPAMTQELAESLVSTRAGLDDESRKSIVWVTKVLSPEIATEIGPYVTTRSNQFSADVTAFGQNDRGFRRVLMVIDYTDKARLIYRHDLTRAGNPMANWDGWKSTQPNEGSKV